MESSDERLTARDAAAALAGADATRARLAQHVGTPPWFFVTLGTVIAVQIATFAVGLGDERPWVLVLGLVLFVIVGAEQLARFRRLNGVWLGGFASRVVLGTSTAASTSYVVALGFAIWAASAGSWGLVALCATGGGWGYAVGGRRWLGAYRAEPATHSRGESVAFLGLLAVPAITGLVLLLINR
jgi:hypothetical protein